MGKSINQVLNELVENSDKLSFRKIWNYFEDENLVIELYSNTLTKILKKPWIGRYSA